MEHLFKNTQYVKFNMIVDSFYGTSGSYTSDFSTDGIYQYINAFVSFKDESITDKSKITGKIFLKQRYWRGNIKVEFKIVNSSMLSSVRTFLEALDNVDNILTGTKSVDIIIGYDDTDSYLVFNNYRCVSDISPSYLADNIMAGEELELEFESVERFKQKPTLNTNFIVTSAGDFLVTADGDYIFA